MFRWHLTRSGSLAHLITSKVTRIRLNYRRPLSSAFRPYSMDAVNQALAALSLKPKVVEHVPADSPAAWRDALATTAAPEPFQLLKTLVYKPKTAKTATAVPVVVLAPEAIQPSSSAIGKKLNLKDLRLASDDLLQEFFSADKDSRKSLSFHLMCSQLF